MQVDALRYSITFRMLREEWAPQSLAPQGDHRVHLRGAASRQE